MKISEITKPNIPKFLYKWVNGKQFQKFLNNKKLPVKRNYAHFIDAKNDFIKGNSFTDKNNIDKWSGDTLIKIDTTKIKNNIYPILGNRTYLKTMGMINNNYDPNSYKYESEYIDEYWIEGTLDLSSAKVIKTINESKMLPEYVYHSTYKENIPNIKKYGLDPSRSKSSLDAVFLAGDEYTAENYFGHHMENKNPTIIRIPLHKLNKQYLGPDNYELQDYLENIDEDEEFYGLDWNMLTWEQSLDLVSQVAYYDKISPKYMEIKVNNKYIPLKSNYTSTITENQKFDFDKYKPQIINYIKRIKSNKEDNFQDETLFYNIITNKPAVGAAKSINVNPQVWKNYFSNKPFNSNGVWSQRDFNTQLKDNSNNINFYITVEKSNDNIIKFIQTLRFLDKDLEELSNKTQSRISYKTHTILDSFMDHNDSLKIYYNNPQLKNQIQTITRQWANNNNVILSNRTHEHGFDTDKSFGERLAKSVNETIKNTIKKYNTYTDEQLFDWIKKYLPEMIQNAKDSKQ